MTEAEWHRASDPLRLLTFLRADWESNRRSLQRFVCATCRRFWPLLGELGLQAAIEVTERDAAGEATFEEANEIAGAAWAVVRGLPASAPGYSAGVAAAWTTCGRGNRYFAEQVVRELLSLNGRWWRIKVLLGGLGFGTLRSERRYHVRLLHDIFGNPFRPAVLNPAWRTANVVDLARAIYDERALPSGTLDRTRLAILADALLDAGCDSADILDHCHSPGPHVRGCWIIDLILGKE